MTAAFFHPGSSRFPSTAIAPSARWMWIGGGGGGAAGAGAGAWAKAAAATAVTRIAKAIRRIGRWFSYEQLRSLDGRVARRLGIFFLVRDDGRGRREHLQDEE